VPFADVEELKPHRLHPHCADAVDEDGHRWCSRSFKKRLADGADIELNWKMHVDPDRILSLDTEAEHGVKISRCAPDELELFVPHSHLQHLEVGKFIVGSPFVHNCQHQPESAMYHKVVQVKRKRTADGGIGNMFHFHIATQAVPHMGWTAKHIEYNFSYMPVEAREIHNPWPERRSYLDHSSESRRLQGFQFPGFAQPSAGNIQSAGQSSGSMQRNNGIVSFNPDQVSNFGWNWDFFLNESKTPKFVIDQPDTQGIFILENPYIKAHAGCFLNFTSKFQGFMKAPHIIWQAGLKGHGIMQGRLRASLNSTRPMSLEASSYKIPSEVLENFPFLRILTKFDKTRWFNQVSHGVGPMAASFTPGFQFQMEVYHKGVFHGFLATGGSTRGVMMPILHFDSLKGFEQTIQGELLNTTVFPPLYKIFTEVFELGVRADPIFHLKGDFMGFQGVEAAMHFRAYQNCTISRQGSVHFDVDARKALVVYPFRVVGPNQLDFNTKYQLKMQAKGVEKVTSPTTSWGQVEFHEPISNCNFGNFTEAEVENVAITVILEKVDTTTGAVTQMGQGSYTVMSWELGIGQPVPTWINIKNAENQAVANAQVYIVHKENVVSFLSSRIKGIGFDFPSVSLIPGQIQNEYKDLPADCPLKIHLILGNRSYLVDVNPKSMGQGAVFTGQTVIELYPSFVDMWAACATTMEFCTSPKIELWCGSQKLGSAPVPPFGIPVPEESNFIEDMLGMQPTMAPAIGTEQTNNLPAVQVTTPNNIPVATITSEVRLSPATASSSFLSPSFAADVTMGEQIEFIWTIADTVAGQAMTFKVIPMKIVSQQQLPDQDLSKYRKIGDSFLFSESDSTQADVPGTCQARPVHGMEASALPCSFAKALAFNSPGFATGDKMIVMVTWMQDNKEHKIYSPAFRLVGGVTMPTMPVPGGTRRLQAAAAAALPPAQSNLRSPSPAPATPAPTLGAGNSSENQSEACARQDLRFNFGQGVEVRLEVLSMGVPQALQQDMPMMAMDDNSGPVYTSPWEAMGGNQPAMEAKDFLPETACEMGMCDTALPGCRQASFKQLYFPRLVFNFSRPYFYNHNETNSTTQKLIQEAMAWAFSAMPEAIQVVLQELEQREKELQQQTAVPNYGFGAYSQPNQNQFGFNNGQQQNNWFNSPQATGNTQQMPQAFGKWWNTQRRLTAKRMGVDGEGRPVEMPSKLMSHQAEVQFRNGLPYRVDHVLLKKMIKSGMIPVDDGHSKKLGKLNIIGFYFEDLGAIQVPESDVHARAGWAGWVTALAACAATAAVAFGVFLRSRCSDSGYKPQLLEAAQCEEGLE